MGGASSARIDAIAPADERTRCCTQLFSGVRVLVVKDQWYVATALKSLLDAQASYISPRGEGCEGIGQLS